MLQVLDSKYAALQSAQDSGEREYRIARLKRHMAELEASMHSRLPKQERQRIDGLRRAALVRAKAADAQAAQAASAARQMDDGESHVEDEASPPGVSAMLWNDELEQIAEATEMADVQQGKHSVAMVDGEAAPTDGKAAEKATIRELEKIDATAAVVTAVVAATAIKELEGRRLADTDAEDARVAAEEAAAVVAAEKALVNDRERDERERAEAERERAEAETEAEQQRDARRHIAIGGFAELAAERVAAEAAVGKGYGCEDSAVARLEAEAGADAVNTPTALAGAATPAATSVLVNSEVATSAVAATLSLCSKSSKKNSNKKKGGGGGGTAAAAAIRTAALARYQTTSVAKPSTATAPAGAVEASKKKGVDGEEVGSGRKEGEAKGNSKEGGSKDARSAPNNGRAADGSVFRSTDRDCSMHNLSSWNGKTPKTMLFEWFQKRQQPRPKIDVEMSGRRYRGIVMVPGGILYELPEGDTFDKREGAEQAAATMALLQLFPDQPLYRLLPPEYRALWLRWAEDEKAPEQQEAAAALMARDKFIKQLCDRPRDASEPTPRVRTVGKAAAVVEATAGELAKHEAAQARARQVTRELEEERMANEEEEREERLALKREQQAEFGMHMQVAYERWRASDDGKSAARQRASLPISAMEPQLRAALQAGQLAIVCGETGSGKSTQVPQMLLEHALESGKGGCTSIICTQPRRIAATALARRVASERGERVGEHGSMVGYQVRTYPCMHP